MAAPCPSLCLQWAFYGGHGFHPLHTPSCTSDHTPAPSGCLLAANPSPLARSVYWSPSFSSQPLYAPTDVCLVLGSAGRWPGLSVLVSFCSAWQNPAAAFSSEPLKLPLCPGWSPISKKLSQAESPIPLSQLHPMGTNPIQIPLFLFFFSFVLPGYLVIFLATLIIWDLLPVFCRYSVRIVPLVGVFLMYLWEEVSSMSF